MTPRRDDAREQRRSGAPAGDRAPEDDGASEAELSAVRLAAGTLIPELTRRLEKHGLGELEVRRGDLRLRIRGGTAAARDRRPADPATPEGAVARPSAAAAGSERAGTPSAADGGGGDGATRDASRKAVRSPAVGIFVYGDGLGPGLDVAASDALGYVDMLGVHHDVRAPSAGRVTNLVAETGEAVEYGQLLIELEASGP